MGALSLECYLIHIHFVLNKLPHDWTYWPKFFACLAITLPLAWALSKGVAWLTRRLLGRWA